MCRVRARYQRQSTRQFAAVEESANMESLDESAESMMASPPIAESESQDLSAGMEITEKAIDSGALGIDLAVPFVIITIILGGLTLYYLLKSRKGN